MSVIMTLRVDGDPKRLEEYASQNQDQVRAIAEESKKAGVIAHRFYGSDEGQIMVIDEWPDAESFQSFFGSMNNEIGGMMQAAGVTGEPQITFWRTLDTHDEVGWGK